MKRKWFLVTALALSVVLAGCAGGDNAVEDELEDAQESVEEAGEKADDKLEEVGEEAQDAIDEAGEDAKDAVDEAGEKADDKLEEVGEKAEDAIKGDDQEWPADFMPNIPEFEGKIFKVKEKDQNNMYVAYEDVTQEEAVEYVKDLKEAGYTNEADEYIASTVVNFKGYDENGDFAKFRWSENGYATVDMIYPEEAEEE